MNEYSMIPNECSPLLECPRLFVAKVCMTAVSLPDLVSHVSAMSALHVVDPFALRCVFDAIRLLVVVANLLQVVLQALEAILKTSNGHGSRGIARIVWKEVYGFVGPLVSIPLLALATDTCRLRF